MRCPVLTDLPPPPSGRAGWPWTEESPQIPQILADGSPWPRMSIVTPSYNQGQFIEQTIRSVLHQGYPNLEYIIIDGGSIDESVEIIRKYERWLAHWVSEPDDGQAAAINKGMTKSTGQILGWLNSDDFLLPGALRKVAEMSQQDPDAVAWIGGCYRVRPDGQILSRVLPRRLDRHSLADWSRKGFFYQPSCFFSARAWDSLGGLDEGLDIAFDFDLWLGLAAVGEFASTSEMLSAATIHREAKTQARRAEMEIEAVMVQFRHDYPEIARDRVARLLDRPPARTRALNALKVALARSALRDIWYQVKRRPPEYLQAVLAHGLAREEPREGNRSANQVHERIID